MTQINLNKIAAGLKIFTFIMFLILCMQIYAATYYVDFDNGNDSNTGTTTSTAWKTIPGTRTVNNSGWQSSSWGTVFDTGNRVTPGTVFRLKRGTTHDSFDGGAIVIDDTFYQEATESNPVIIELYTSWGTGSITLDGLGVTEGIGLFQIRINGIKIDGKVANGIVIQNSNHSGIYVKEKAGSGDSVDGTVVKYIKFFNNGRIYTSSNEGTGDGQVKVRKANGITISNCEFDGNNIHVNGLLLGDSNMSVINAFVSNTVAYNHAGNDPPNDCGVGFKALNGQVTYDNCVAYNNLKGWDLGESNGQNRDILYKVVNSTTKQNSYGINMNCAATSSYTGNVQFYIINSIIEENTFHGSNIYAGPFNLYIVHNVFSRNGSDTSSIKYKGNLNITPNSELDTSVIKVSLYNNIFYKPAGHSNLIVKYSVSSNNFSLYSDFNSWIEDDSPHSNGQYFSRWSYFESPAVDFSYGANGPGNSSGNWYQWYNNSGTPPATSGIGHFHADSHSVGTGTSNPQEPPFQDAVGGDYSLTSSFTGMNLTTEAWYIPEMGSDRNGIIRSTWDMGAFESGQINSAPGAPRGIRLQ